MPTQFQQDSTGELTPTKTFNLTWYHYVNAIVVCSWGGSSMYARKQCLHKEPEMICCHLKAEAHSSGRTTNCIAIGIVCFILYFWRSLFSYVVKCIVGRWGMERLTWKLSFGKVKSSVRNERDKKSFCLLHVPNASSSQKSRYLSS